MTPTNTPEINYGRDNFVEQHGLWTDAQRSAAQEVREKISEHKIRFVRMVFADVHGIVRGKTITVGDFFPNLSQWPERHCRAVDNGQREQHCDAGVR